jgi:hypothetical protein
MFPGEALLRPQVDEALLLELRLHPELGREAPSSPSLRSGSGHFVAWTSSSRAFRSNAPRSLPFRSATRHDETRRARAGRRSLLQDDLPLLDLGMDDSTSPIAGRSTSVPLIFVRFIAFWSLERLSSEASRGTVRPQ